MIDIVVPVYKGLAETMACLHSLLAISSSATPFEIVLVNDASPERALTRALKKFCKAVPHATYLENAHNLGFVKSVNRGIALHPERDVLLLNSDTVCPAGDWLARMKAAAYSDARIATVTPFSNRATICSLPAPNVDNTMPDVDQGATILDTLCARVNPGVRIEIPTSIGFCMYIKRAALDEVGLFDARRWGKGYGEENDFCMKASGIGWKHVAACDVFVEHHGAVSFGQQKTARINKNLRRLVALYPDYEARIADFIRHDPLAIPRSRIILWMMQQLNNVHKVSRQTLHITHALGGGVKHHVDKLTLISGVILRPARQGYIEIHQTRDRLSLFLPVATLNNGMEGKRLLLECLRALNIDSVHIHQWIGLPSWVWQIPEWLGCAFDVTEHDYYLFCPRVTLLDDKDAYCGQGPVSRCTACLRGAPLGDEIAAAYRETGQSIRAWRAFNHNYLSRARQVIAPSRDAARRLTKAFPDIVPDVVPNEAAPIDFKPRRLPRPGQALRVAVIGAIGQHKGYKKLLATARAAIKHAPHIHFCIVGFTMNDRPFKSLNNVTITGEYDLGDLPRLIRRQRCHVALFLSEFPETYCYTLSEALAAGLTPIAQKLGALGDRVGEVEGGRLLPENPGPVQIIKCLLDISGRA